MILTKIWLAAYCSVTCRLL